MVMYQLKQNSKKAPFGGHQYHEYGVTFSGASFDAVVEKLKAFRLNNSITYGDPEQEVLAYYADKWPWLVERVDEEGEREEEDYAAWRDWVHKTWRSAPTKLIVPKEAQDRWDICEKCPFNMPDEFGNGPEPKELRRRAFLMRRGVDVPKHLGYCSHHRADLGAFTFIQNAKVFSALPKEGEPFKGCWT